MKALHPKYAPERILWMDYINDIICKAEEKRKTHARTKSNNEKILKIFSMKSVVQQLKQCGFE